MWFNLKRSGALLTGDAAAADDSRRFRSIAAHACDNFDRARAKPAVEAASVLVRKLVPQLAVFRQAVDP